MLKKFRCKVCPQTCEDGSAMYLFPDAGTPVTTETLRLSLVRPGKNYAALTCTTNADVLKTADRTRAGLVFRRLQTVSATEKMGDYNICF